MYYQNYEDYMRSVLGYPMENQNTYEQYNYNVMPYDNYNMVNNQDLSDLYPDIYKLIQPMVQKICEANTKTMTKELLDQMTEEIYLNLENIPEVDTVVNVRVSTPKETNSKSTSSYNNSSKISSSQNRKEAEVRDSKTNRENREDRQRIPNRTLQDLIRILILNQLLGGGNRPTVRPPRPPFPGPGPRPPVRPPFPRDNRPYDEYLKF